ncbi:MAG: signal peptidase I [Propionibacteriaceae bacterium]|nr:signal peptidase I [Propionibacteriaceae bacterium]
MGERLQRNFRAIFPPREARRAKSSIGRDAVRAFDIVLPVPPRRARRTPGELVSHILKEIAIIAVLGLSISIVVRLFVMQWYVVPSPSMERTLMTDDRIVVWKMSDYDRGDVVVFEDTLGWLPDPAQPTGMQAVLEFVGLAPSSAEQYLVKRIIGLPGDKVECCTASGQIIVNGSPLDETSYLYRSSDAFPAVPSRRSFSLVVPEGRMFVLGDNRDNSADSLYHLCVNGAVDVEAGFPSLETVQGPVWAIGLPFNRATRFHTPQTYAAVPAPAEPAPQVGTATITCS